MFFFHTLYSSWTRRSSASVASAPSASEPIIAPALESMHMPRAPGRHTGSVTAGGGCGGRAASRRVVMGSKRGGGGTRQRAKPFAPRKNS